MTNTMVTRKHDHDNETMIDVILFKAIGLNQLLHPSSKTEHGKLNNRYRKIFLAVQWMVIGIQCMQIIRLYLEMYNLYVLLNVIFLIGQTMNNVLKAIVLVMNEDKMWSLLDVARYGFTSFGSKDSSLQHQSGSKVSKWLRIFAGLCFITLFIWTIAPLFTNEYVQFVKLDGTIGHYRMSIFNLWFPVTESMYNWPPIWTLIYVIEVLITINGVYAWVLFDCYMVTVCLVLSKQFNNVSAAYKSIGHYRQNRVMPYSLDIHTKNEGMKKDFCDNLILCMKDNQKIIEKFDEFYDIIQKTMKIQTMISTYSIVITIFLTMVAYLMDWSVVSAQVMKPLSALVSLTIQFYIYCYIFSRVETEKSSLNFGLYSSNWTEMDLNYKKTLLLSMCMNSAKTQMIKLSPQMIVNLEMFTKVLKMSFTIVSVLLKVLNVNAEDTNRT